MDIRYTRLGRRQKHNVSCFKQFKAEAENICDLNEEMCKQRCKEFGFDKYTTKYEDMLNDPAIDIIAIYTPDHLHAEHIKQALLHDKHVVCTKPFIDDLSKAKELIELQKKTGKKVFVGQSSRFFEPYKKQRKDFEEGLIGELITIESHYNADHRWFLRKEMGVGKIIQMVIWRTEPPG